MNFNKFQSNVNGNVLEFALNTPLDGDSEEDATLKAERLAAGTLVDLVTCVPSNPSGEAKNIWYPQFSDQDVKSGMTSINYHLFSLLKGNPYVQVYDERDDHSRKYGYRGWIHFTKLDLTSSVTRVSYIRTVKEGRKMVNKSIPVIINNPTYWDKQFSIFKTVKEVNTEWLRMVKKTDFTWNLQEDNTQDGRSGLGWGGLLASNRVALHTGVTFRVAPRVWSYEIKEGERQGEMQVMDKAQQAAQQLYVACQAIEKGEITVEDAGRQFFQDRLFNRISFQNADEGNDLDEEITVAITEASDAEKNGEEAQKIGLTVVLDGIKLDFKDLPAGNYVVSVDGEKKVRYHENRTFTGKKRLAKAVGNYGERLSIEKAQGNLS